MSMARVPTDQLLWARRRGEVDKSKVGLRRLSGRVVGKTVRRMEGRDEGTRGGCFQRATASPAVVQRSAVWAAPTRKSTAPNQAWDG